MINRHKRIIEQAVELAKTVEMFGDAKVAAILANKNRIISYGFNSSKSHTIATRYDTREGAIFPHAEVVAIHNASRNISLRDTSKCTIYVARVKRPNAKSRAFTWGMSKPCPACQQAVGAFGIRHAIWTTNDCDCDEWKGGEW